MVKMSMGFMLPSLIKLQHALNIGIDYIKDHLLHLRITYFLNNFYRTLSAAL